MHFYLSYLKKLQEQKTGSKVIAVSKRYKLSGGAIYIHKYTLLAPILSVAGQKIIKLGNSRIITQRPWKGKKSAGIAAGPCFNSPSCSLLTTAATISLSSSISMCSVILGACWGRKKLQKSNGMYISPDWSFMLGVSNINTRNTCDHYYIVLERKIHVSETDGFL